MTNVMFLIRPPLEWRIAEGQGGAGDQKELLAGFLETSIRWGWLSRQVD
jgi:hypothetical protein